MKLNGQDELCLYSTVQRLDWKSMSVLKYASSWRLNLFTTYVKDILLRSTKNSNRVID